MPRDLFGDVVVRPASTRSRRSPLFLLSLGAHCAALLVGVAATLVAVPALPGARELPKSTVVFPADIELPSAHSSNHTARRASSPAPTPVVAVPIIKAPVAPSDGILPENPAAGDLGLPASIARIEGSGGDPLDGRVSGAPFRPEPVAIQPPPPAQEPVRLHSGIRAPQKIFNIDPLYPAIARGARVEGVVILEATVDTSGSVTGLRVLRSVTLLDQAALDAVRQWRFTPALLNGDPIAVIMTITVRFTIGAEAR